MSEKVVEVMMGPRKVGRLALNKSNQVLFEYDSEWIRNGFSISPFHLPLESKLFTADAKPFNGNFGVFDDSLPDGWSALVLDRYLRSQGKSLASLSLLEQLMFVGQRPCEELRFHPSQRHLAACSCLRRSPMRRLGRFPQPFGEWQLQKPGQRRRRSACREVWIEEG